MNYNNLPEEVKHFIKNVEEVRNLQKRYFLATRRNTANSNERLIILSKCKQKELEIDRLLINLKNNYTQLEAI